MRSITLASSIAAMILSTSPRAAETQPLVAAVEAVLHDFQMCHDWGLFAKKQQSRRDRIRRQSLTLIVRASRDFST
jgi:hypothetical protein